MMNIDRVSDEESMNCAVIIKYYMYPTILFRSS